MNRPLSRGWGCRWTAVWLLLACAVGCTPSGSDQEAKKGGSPLDGVHLRLVVVDDPAMADAIGKLEGEWRALSGSRLTVSRTTEAELLKAQRLDADALLCPTYLLGPLAERQWLAPLPKEMTAKDRKAWADLFEAVRCREAVWGTTPMAVPFGSPVLTCYYRADLFEALKLQPPTTWEEYGRLLETLAAKLPEVQGGKTVDPVAEPLGPGWAGLTFLARAVPAAKHPDNYSTLFDIATMRPLIDSPPMVRALGELVAAAKHGPADQLSLTPAEIRKRFWQGRCALALTWPSAAAGDVPDKTPPSVRLGVAELPGSTTVYDIDEQKWKTRAKEDDVRVPLLGVTGRIGVVARSSAHTDGAADLLAWLSGGDLSPPPSARSPHTTLCRRSQTRFPKLWVESPLPVGAAGEYADLTERTMTRRQWVFALRIPGRSEYLAALDAAVQQAVRGEKTPEESLRSAAAAWQAITERLGLERQRTAYLRGLGLEP